MQVLAPSDSSVLCAKSTKALRCTPLSTETVDSGLAKSRSPRMISPDARYLSPHTQRLCQLTKLSPTISVLSISEISAPYPRSTNARQNKKIFTCRPRLPTCLNERLGHELGIAISDLRSRACSAAGPCPSKGRADIQVVTPRHLSHRDARTLHLKSSCWTSIAPTPRFEQDH